MATPDTSDKLPIDQIAQLGYDNSVLYFGIIPVVIVGVVAIVGAALYFFRRSKSWNELGEAMRLEDEQAGKAPATATDVPEPSAFGSQQMAKMEPPASDE